MMCEISTITSIDPSSPDDLFVVCGSFEQERAVASTAKLSRFRARCVIVINFLSDTNPDGERKKRQTTGELLTALRTVDTTGIPRLISIGPHDYLGLIALLREELQSRLIGLTNLNISIDISCLTKIQLILLLKTIMEDGMANNIRLIYTTPQRYNTRGTKFERLSIGYFDPVPVPLSVPSRSAITDVRRIAFLVLGHEGQRTMCAWRKVDPEKTFLMAPSSQDKDDAALIKICGAQNRFLLEQARMGHPEFARIECDRLDIEGARTQFARVCKAEAKSSKIRVSVVPFGPKPLVVGVLLGALSVADAIIDLMYPIPTSYNSRYSEGVKGVYTFIIRSPAAHA